MSNENSRLYVSNLNYETNEQEIRAAFEAFGPVSDVKIITDRETGRARGFAFVQMSTNEDAREAINQLHDSMLGGRSIRVAVANPRPPRQNVAGNGEREQRGNDRGNDRSRRNGNPHRSRGT